jgi:hypothetical protein
MTFSPGSLPWSCTAPEQARFLEAFCSSFLNIQGQSEPCERRPGSIATELVDPEGVVKFNRTQIQINRSRRAAAESSPGWLPPREPTTHNTKSAPAGLPFPRGMSAYSLRLSERDTRGMTPAPVDSPPLSNHSQLPIGHPPFALTRSFDATPAKCVVARGSLWEG